MLILHLPFQIRLVALIKEKRFDDEEHCLEKFCSSILSIDRESPLLERGKT